MVPYYGQQIPQVSLNLLDLSRELRQPRGEFPEPLRLELLVVHDYGSTLTHRIAQRCNEGFARIASVHSQEFEVLRCRTRLPLYMHRPLERQVIVGMHTGKSRDRRVDG